MKITSDTKLLVKRILNYRVPGNYSKIRKDDTFLVSYPKSGNTWLRFIIGNLINKEKVDFNNFNEIVPDIYQTFKNELDKCESPRIIKSHEPFVKEYPKVIYVYRDPRDVVISYYFWHKKYNIDFTDSIEEYIYKFINGTNSPYGAWDKHLYSWFNSVLSDDDKILFLQYEDLKKNPLTNVNEIADFLNLNVSQRDIINAIMNSKFKKMQKLEKDQNKTSKFLKNSRKDINFVRSGKSEWHHYLKDDLKEKFKIKYGKILIDLSYENDLDW